MARLTRKQQAELRQILHDAQRALDYIMGERVVVARVGGGTTLAYTRTVAPDVAEALRVEAGTTAITPVAKDIGSHLCGLPSAVAGLKQFIAAQSV